MPDETQRLTKSDGSTVTVSRNGNHHYRVNGGPPLPSVTSLIGHIAGDSFGAAMGWPRKRLDQSGGDCASNGASGGSGIVILRYKFQN